MNSGRADADTHLNAIISTRSALLGLLTPVAVVVGGVAALLSYLAGQEQNRRTWDQNREALDVQRRGQVTERFTRAIEQLGSDTMDLRIGGAYALEQIARDSSQLHWPIMEVLTAYLRKPPNSALRAAKKPRSKDRAPADVQAVATVIGRRHGHRDEGRLDLDRANLNHVQWQDAVLEGASFIEAWLMGVDLSSASLGEARLWFAHMEYGCLEKADLGETDLEGAHLIGANLDDAFLEGAVLHFADLENASLKNANLTNADLSEAILNSASLRNARLIGADLSDAASNDADLTNADLEHANLTRASLIGADFTNACLNGADFREVDLTQAHGLTSEQLELARNVDEGSLPPYLLRSTGMQTVIEEVTPE